MPSPLWVALKEASEEAVYDVCPKFQFLNSLLIPFLAITGPPVPSSLWVALKEASEEAAWEMAAGRLVALELILPPAPKPEVCVCCCGAVNVTFIKDRLPPVCLLSYSHPSQPKRTKECSH